jgi:hypothetical protein
MSDDELYFGDFERAGEDVVRNNLALKLYVDKRAGLASEWLARKERSRREISNSEQIRIARSAKNAAWLAAIAAIVAAIVAAIAAVIAYYSLKAAPPN